MHKKLKKETMRNNKKKKKKKNNKEKKTWNQMKFFLKVGMFLFLMGLERKKLGFFFYFFVFCFFD